MASNQDKKKVLNKSLIAGFLVGVLVGPLATLSMGWQVSSSTLAEKLEDARIEQQAKFCVAAAKAEANGQTLDNDTRYKLARKWAKMPWQEQADESVFNQCFNTLG